MGADLIFKNVPFDHLKDAIYIEQQGFPPDEAASLEAFQLRQRQASDLFLGAYQHTGTGDQLIGYVCSTLSADASLTHDSMATHVPNSSSVCIHSVCVSPACRKQGVGLKLLREYVARLVAARRKESAPYERILLITHENLRDFYEKAGFEWLGLSAVVHGSQPWFEMRIVIGATFDSSSAAVYPSQALSEALQRPSGNSLAKPLSSFPGGVAEVTLTESNALLNKFDLLCPRPGCGSVILKSGVARLSNAPPVQMEAVDQPRHSLLASTLAAEWWMITPSPMEFENIGFSHAVDSQGEKMKLLTCAECDLGPLGWCMEGGTEFWLACSRVCYRKG